MADSSENKSNGLPIPALASMLLLLVGAVMQHLNPLDSPRPTTVSSVNSQYVNIEDVNARLWQDPFTAISKHESKQEAEICFPARHADKKTKDTADYDCSSNHSIASFVRSIADVGNKNPNITVLGVMVSGGDYAENIESRRRTRYAVLSGLAVKDYVPKEHEHIGYVEGIEDISNYAKSKKDESIKYMPEKIPFEWFQFDKEVNRPPLLVLWLDDTVFASMPRPLQMTNDFIKRMKEATKPANLTFKFIGPASSNTLQIMIDELATGNFDFCSKQDICDFQYYNASATGDWPGMNIPATQDNKKKDNYKKTIQTYIESLESQKYSNLSSLFTRTSLTDYQLAAALLTELALRGFEIKSPPSKSYPPNYPHHYPHDNQDHIVIISEWDTIYGRRGLPKAMKEQLVPMKSYCSEEDVRTNQCDWPTDVNWIHSFSYMRGLDGVTLGTEKKTEETKADKNKEKDKNSAEINLERPEGENQQDYLRRLAVHIDELKQRLKNNDKGEEIKAIGVLGSDAYDKLMILKALRPFFPKALFFTTDLDTRLMHPKEFDVYSGPQIQDNSLSYSLS